MDTGYIRLFAVEACMTDSVLALGLMSGTSADGVDVALIRTDGERAIEFIAATTVPYDQQVRAPILEAARQDIPLNDLLRLEQHITALHAVACESLLSRISPKLSAEVAIVGFHGHTIRHSSEERLTWQIGDASRLAERLNIPVVSDFRRRDLAAGGQGAPLAALFHQALLAHVQKPTVVLNLGGVANITWIAENELLAGDVGPGCCLIDEWTMHTTDQAYDEGGRLANRGRVDEATLTAAMSLPFFAKPLPKSADRFDFDGIDVTSLNPADGAATLCAVTVAAVCGAINRLPKRPSTLWVTGGGARNSVLMAGLRETFPFAARIDQAGLRPDSLEAECFAWLAVRRLRGLPLSIPSTTGCRHEVVGGLLTALDPTSHA